MTTPDTTSRVRTKRLVELRKQSGFNSREQLAVAAGLGSATVKRAEKGEPGVKYETIEKLARVLNVSVSELWEGSQATRQDAIDDLAALEGVRDRAHEGPPPQWALDMEARAIQRHDKVMKALDDIQKRAKL